MKKNSKNEEKLMDNIEEVAGGILSVVSTDTEIDAYTEGLKATKEIYLEGLKNLSKSETSSEDKENVEKILESWDKKVADYNNCVDRAGERGKSKLEVLVQAIPWCLLLCIIMGDEETRKKFLSYEGKLPELGKVAQRLIARK